MAVIQVSLSPMLQMKCSRGCLEEALELLTENQIEIQLDDQRERGTKHKSTKSLVKLRKNQQAAVRAMSKHGAGILHAPTAFDKTPPIIKTDTDRNRQN